MTNNIQVHVRVKPSLSEDSRAVKESLKSINVDKHVFSYQTSTLGPEKDQGETYQAAMRNVFSSIEKGFSFTLFAYGCRLALEF